MGHRRFSETLVDCQDILQEFDRVEGEQSGSLIGQATEHFLPVRPKTDQHLHQQPAVRRVPRGYGVDRSLYSRRRYRDPGEVFYGFYSVRADETQALRVNVIKLAGQDTERPEAVYYCSCRISSGTVRLNHQGPRPSLCASSPSVSELNRLRSVRLCAGCSNSRHSNIRQTHVL